MSIVRPPLVFPRVRSTNTADTVQKENRSAARPFLDWHRDKGVVLDTAIRNIYAPHYGSLWTNYTELFAGYNGAVLLDVLGNYPVGVPVLAFSTEPLRLVYYVLRQRVDRVISGLTLAQATYNDAPSPGLRSQYYRNVRKQFNLLSHLCSSPVTGSIDHKVSDDHKISLAVFYIFLSKTCFGRFHRIDSDGDFIVPEGKYKNPVIFDTENLEAVSAVLQRITMDVGQFLIAPLSPLPFRNLDNLSSRFFGEGLFCYICPPCRFTPCGSPPPSAKKSAAVYGRLDRLGETFGEIFSDEEHRLLFKAVVRRISETGGYFIVRVPDPRNVNPDDDFFDNLYGGGGFTIHRVPVNHVLNPDGSLRIILHELLITNFP
jgi:DNA adenine methylase